MIQFRIVAGVKRVRITDATTESVADLLANTWRGLLLSRDELSGWLGSMDRYSGGGDRPFWLEAFGGRSYTVDRKGKPDPIMVEHLSVSILGGTQPDKLNSMLVKSDDDGLTARFMVVFPGQVPLCRPSETLDEQFAIDAFRRLRSLLPATAEHGSDRPFFVHFDEPAQVALQDFRQQCQDWEGDAHWQRYGRSCHRRGNGSQFSNRRSFGAQGGNQKANGQC